MRRIETLNSIYEVDDGKIRRVSGVNEPTESFGADGEWREFAHIRAFGPDLAILWPNDTVTFTSRVVSDEPV